MELIIVRHGETAWTISGQYTGATDLPLTPDGERQAALLRPLVECVLHGRHAAVYSSPRQRALQTTKLVLPDAVAVVEPLIAEYDYGAYEGLTPDQVSSSRPGWDIWRDGCPDGESTRAVGRRADEFLRTSVEEAPGAIIVVSHGHFSRILAARTLGLAAERGHIFASATASVSLIHDHHGERCIELWNASADLVHESTTRSVSMTATPRPAAGLSDVRDRA